MRSYKPRVHTKGTVVCQICGVKLRCIQYKHTEMHNLTPAEYRLMFPEAQMYAGDFFSEQGYANAVESWRKIGLANKGRKHTAEETEKRAMAIRGRSYEDQMGKEKADQLREDRRRCFDWAIERGVVRENAIKGSKKHKLLMASDPEYRAKHHRNLSKALYKIWNDMSVDDKNKRVKNTIRAMNIRPNKPETYILSLLNFAFPNEWEYVGDGKIVINGKNPDFININGRKQIIELFGDFWHRGENPEDRKKIFRKYGYKTLIIWECELVDIPKLYKKIVRFGGQ